MSDSLHEYARPRIVVSRCLKGELVRYNAELLADSVAELLQPFVNMIPVCPEVEMGMPVPRPPIQVHRSQNLTLHQPSTGKNLTEPMRDFCNSLEFTEVDGFLLKARSPSCAIFDTPHYQLPPSNKPKSGPSELGEGLFTHYMKKKYFNIPYFDEDRYKNPILRDWFLTSSFLAASKRLHGESRINTLDHLYHPQLGFQYDAELLWPQKLFQFYSHLAHLDMASFPLPKYFVEPLDQLLSIQQWRSEQTSRIHHPKMTQIIHPYPPKLQ